MSGVADGKTIAGDSEMTENTLDSLVDTCTLRNMDYVLLAKSESGLDPQQMVGDPGQIYACNSGQTDYEVIWKAALEKFGARHQIIKAIEEMSELIVELTKYLNGQQMRVKELRYEIADVNIMINQLEKIFIPNDIELYDMIETKMARLERLVNEK